MVGNGNGKPLRTLARRNSWASLRQITPEAVDVRAIERFVAELQNATLIRNLRYVRRFVSKRWNERWRRGNCNPSISSSLLRRPSVAKCAIAIDHNESIVKAIEPIDSIERRSKDLNGRHSLRTIERDYICG